MSRDHREVREEDAFDVERVHAWLAAELGEDLGSLPEVRQFSGGVSNLTYLLRYPGRDLILRRPPHGVRTGTAHDVAREYRIQASLAPVFPYVPPMVALCEDDTVLGAPFYVMDRIQGPIPRQEFPAGLDLDPGQAEALCSNVLDVLVSLHSIDPGDAGLEWLSRGEGYVARQVGGWSKRYRAAKTWNVPSFAKVIDWLERNQPRDRGQVVIHGDFRLDNIVLEPADPTTPAALLDWELATIGDPLMDLGSALAYWVEAGDGPLFKMFRRQPSHVPGMYTRERMVDEYCRRAGIGLEPGEWSFYEVFGLFRLAVICQQVYYRYHHKQTTNPAFRNFAFAVVLLHGRCRRAMRLSGRR